MKTRSGEEPAYEGIDHQPRRYQHQDRRFRRGGAAVQKSIDHSAQELDRFDRVIDQADFRQKAILDAVTEGGFRLTDFAAVCGRGGLYRPIPSGTYAVNDRVMHDVETAPYGEHPSNLGAYLARRIGDMVGIPAFSWIRCAWTR